jgi:hypothetical protein
MHQRWNSLVDVYVWLKGAVGKFVIFGGIELFSSRRLHHSAIIEQVKNIVHSIIPGNILKGEVSLYCWPPVWLVWNQLYDNNWQFLFLFAKQTNPNQSNRRLINGIVILPPLVIFPDNAHVHPNRLSWPSFHTVPIISYYQKAPCLVPIGLRPVWFEASGLYYKSCTIIIYDCNHSTIVGSVLKNYDSS